MKETITFKAQKETKNTVKFEEQGHKNLVGTLYVQKHTFRDLESLPQEITVTIEAK